MEKQIFVIGHKNPDTDSVCSAIAYANLKNSVAIREGKPACYEARRAGQINNETKFVLETFQEKAPRFISDVGTQIQDIEIKETKSVDKNMSIKNAWNLMRDTSDTTLPVVHEDGTLEGIISVNDIATANMDVFETGILSLAKTPYKNVLEAIEGTMIVGDEDSIIEKGKILVGAANPDVMEEYIEEGDILITGNRFESHLCAIEMKAGCLIACANSNVSKTIQNMAARSGCKIICTPYATYTVARIINQSTPIEYFMKKDNIVTFCETDFVSDIKETMAKIRYRDFPVVDEEGRYTGMLSRRFLINMDKKKIILVDHNEKTQAVDGIDEAEILEIIDHHRIGNLETVSPVYFRNQPLGCTATIIYQMYVEQCVELDKKIAGLLCSAILSDTLMFRSPTCTPLDKVVAEKLAEIAGLEIEKYAAQMFHAGSAFADMTTEEVFYQDYKKFANNGIDFGAGQISSMEAEELAALKPRLIEFMEHAIATAGVDMLFFMLTNILEESTELLYVGEKAEEIVKNAFGEDAKDSAIVVKDIVSRKKQLVPMLINAMK